MMRRVDPNIATLLSFVPCFQLIWMFLCHIGIAQSLNRASAAQGSGARLSVGLVVSACCLQLVPSWGVLLAPPFWFAYMWWADRIRAKLGRIDAHELAKVF